MAGISRGGAAPRGTGYKSFLPPRSVLGLFWAPLSQMTCTPTHFYPNYDVWSKIIFLVEGPFKTQLVIYPASEQPVYLIILLLLFVFVRCICPVYLYLYLYLSVVFDSFAAIVAVQQCPGQISQAVWRPNNGVLPPALSWSQVTQYCKKLRRKLFTLPCTTNRV